MRKGLRVILGGLSLFCLASGISFSAEMARPNSLQLLPPDALHLSKQVDPSEPGYILDKSLINGAAKAVEPAETPDMEIENKQDLTAVNIKTETSITPYIGAGVVETETPQAAPGTISFESDKEGEGPAYRLGAGLGCKLNGSARLDLGYRYSNDKLTLIPGTQPGTAEDGPDEDHHISVGLKMAF